MGNWRDGNAAYWIGVEEGGYAAECDRDALRAEVETLTRERDLAHAMLSPRGEVGPYTPALISEGDLAALRSRCADLEAGLGALVARLDHVHADASYRAVWMIAQWHRGPYTGPTYTAEFAAARALLRSPTGGTTTSKEG